MNAFAVVTDSTSNLSPGSAEQMGIPFIPLTIHWGEDSYLDCVTLDAPSFYRQLQERRDVPTTSQPSAGAFVEFFQRVAAEQQTDTILGIFISADLSGTMASAAQAKMLLAEQRPDLHIELVDSRSVSLGLGMQVLVAKRAADAGKSLEDTLAEVKHCEASSDLLFAVDTLEFLHRGGRIGGAARLVGSALNLKPVLMIEDGRVEPLEKVRSRAKSLRRVVELAEARLQGKQPTEVSLLHAGADDDPDFVSFENLVIERLKPPVLHKGILTPVVGTHGGPGTIGIAFYTDGEPV